MATVVATAVDPAARDAVSRMGERLVAAMGGEAIAPAEPARDDRTFLNVPYRPNQSDVNYASAQQLPPLSGAFGDYLAQGGEFDQKSFEFADGSVPRQVQVAGWPLLALAGGGGATASGTGAGAAAATTWSLVGILAYFGITNVPEEAVLSLASPVLTYRELVLAFMDRQPARTKVLATYPDDLPDLTKPLGGEFPEPISPILATYPDNLSPDREGFTPSDEPGVQILTNEEADPPFDIEALGEVGHDDARAIGQWAIRARREIKAWETKKQAEFQAERDKKMEELNRWWEQQSEHPPELITQHGQRQRAINNLRGEQRDAVRSQATELRGQVERLAQEHRNPERKQARLEREAEALRRSQRVAEIDAQIRALEEEVERHRWQRDTMRRADFLTPDQLRDYTRFIAEMEREILDLKGARLDAELGLDRRSR